MTTHLKFLLSAFLLMLNPWLSTATLAEKADKNKPMDILADKLTHDDIQQLSTYTGNVILTKGTITLRGDKMVIRQDPEGYQYGIITGKLASFRQKREGVDQFIEGYGLEINYNGKTEVVRFTERANVRRLEKEKIMDEIQGKIVIYDSRNENYTVEGGSTDSATGTNPSGRVKVTIQPKNTDETSAAPGSSVKPTTTTTKPAVGTTTLRTERSLNAPK
jgi:lipopolysaccharide export system protein LptA